MVLKEDASCTSSAVEKFSGTGTSRFPVETRPAISDNCWISEVARRATRVIPVSINRIPARETTSMMRVS